MMQIIRSYKLCHKTIMYFSLLLTRRCTCAQSGRVTVVVECVRDPVALKFDRLYNLS